MRRLATLRSTTNWSYTTGYLPHLHLLNGQFFVFNCPAEGLEITPTWPDELRCVQLPLEVFRCCNLAL